MCAKELTDDYYDALCYADDADDVQGYRICYKCYADLDSGDDDLCFRCWHLEHIGEVKAHVLYWVSNGDGTKQIIERLNQGFWLRNMTKSTIERLKRAIINKKSAIDLDARKAA
jgi:hypothetical protein